MHILYCLCCPEAAANILLMEIGVKGSEPFDDTLSAVFIVAVVEIRGCAIPPPASRKTNMHTRLSRRDCNMHRDCAMHTRLSMARL